MSFTDHHFLFDEARKAFLKICRPFQNDDSKMLLSFLAVFYIGIKKSVGLLECILRDLKHNERFTGELRIDSRHESQEVHI